MKDIEQYTLEGFLTSHRYKKGSNGISLVYPHRYTMDLFEIYCIAGDLFDDIERYDTLQEAEKRIKELLK